MRTDFRARFALVYDKHKKSVLDALPENEKELVSADMPSMVIIFFIFILSICVYSSLAHFYSSISI